jgi:hypothetical protein
MGDPEGELFSLYGCMCNGVNGESVGMAAEVAHGTCTDLPPTKKK